MIALQTLLRNTATLSLVAAHSVAVVACGEPGSSPPTSMESEEELIERARGIHDRVITLDTHIDINTANFTDERNYTMDLPTQATLPKMAAGKLDVGWFVVYTAQGLLDEDGFETAYANALDKFAAIHRTVDEYAPDQIELALTSDDVYRIVGEGKLVAMIGVENAYSLGMDLSRIAEFHQMGARYMSLAHTGPSQFSDAHSGENDGNDLHGGLSEMGRQAIREMNRLGIMIDISHPSKESILQTLELSRAPVIASHSAARALSDVSRNLDDELLHAVAENGGVVQTVALRAFVKADKARARAEALEAIEATIAAETGFQPPAPNMIRDLAPEERDAYLARRRDIRNQASQLLDRQQGPPDVDVADFIDHVDYMVNLIGLNHVGISSDFDGGGGVQGWDDASETFNVTLELVRRGYTEEEIGLLWSGNLLRVLDEVQAVAHLIQAEG